MMMDAGTLHVVAGKVRWVPRDWRTSAAALQRKGWTLSEIATELNVPRQDVVRVLYSEVVRD